eukprot:Plantae.Rhodophyta-Rhodochaete_pulchella.ctg25957.p3 GENE.Plantae.Rhodophyta-Rhodochaete_pulchella.ctg25957~~Plantae.Rhodophyta-Rhodochaete_pulchella.ctg25957.p3  ORF type:complete len:113 (+),score=7.77 Plantae.Rhodophyta-Rhodochaete_pulchella.ctg25957:479-817(+)
MRPLSAVHSPYMTRQIRSLAKRTVAQTAHVTLDAEMNFRCVSGEVRPSLERLAAMQTIETSPLGASCRDDRPFRMRFITAAYQNVAAIPLELCRSVWQGVRRDSSCFSAKHT